MMDERGQRKEDRAFTDFAVRGGCFPLLMGAGTLAAIFVPYIIAMIKKDFPPFLPIISHAAGLPPQSGIFAVLLTLLPFPGAFYLLVNYADVKRKNEEGRRFIDLMNKAALVSGFWTLGGLLITAAFSLGNIVDEYWKYTIAIPHLFGAGSILLGQYYHMGFMMIIMLIMRSKWDRKTLAARATICCLFYATSYIFLYPAYKHAKKFTAQEGMPTLTKEFDINYMLTSLCEWLLIILLVFYLWSYVTDCHKYTVVFSVRKIESENEITIDCNGSNRNFSKNNEQNGVLNIHLDKNSLSEQRVEEKSNLEVQSQ